MPSRFTDHGPAVGQGGARAQPLQAGPRADGEGLAGRRFGQFQLRAVGRCVALRQLHAGAEPQPAFHRRQHIAGRCVVNRSPQRDAGPRGKVLVIAALESQGCRHPQRLQQVVGPRSQRNDHLARRCRAAIPPAQLPKALGVPLQRRNLALHQVAAAGLEQRGIRLHHPPRIVDRAGVLDPQGALEDGAQMRLQVPQGRLIQLLRGDFKTVVDIACEAAALEGLRAAIQEDPSVVAQTVRDTRFLHQAPVLRHGQADQCIESGGGFVEGPGTGTADKADAPHRLPQHVERVVAKLRRLVGQQARQGGPQARVVEGNQRAAREDPGIAIRRLLARRLAVEKLNLQAAPLQLQRAAHPDHPGADHGHGFIRLH